MNPTAPTITLPFGKAYKGKPITDVPIGFLKSVIKQGWCDKHPEHKKAIENHLAGLPADERANPFYNEDLAKRFLAEGLAPYGQDGACYWQGDTYLYNGKRYVCLEDRELAQTIRRFLLRKAIPQDNRLLGNVTPIIQALLYKDKREYPSLPFFLSGGQSSGMQEALRASNIIAYNNGLLDLEGYLNGKPALMPHTPLWVSTTVLPYDYNPDATCPQWEQFLGQVFKGAEEQIDLLQEWFGYCLTWDTSKQKFLLCIGSGRNGKGTVWTVLRGLIGDDAAAAFSLQHFATEFGLSGLIGKPVAYCGEVEIRGCDKARIVQVIKAITGEDTIQIDRKNRDLVSLVLPTRLVMACNDMPRLFETTDALASRILPLHFTQSFQGKEDYGLGKRLLGELPGIANWALKGLVRLRANDRFTIPAITEKAINEFRRDNSPTIAFVQDCLIVERRLDTGSLVGVEWSDGELEASKRDIEVSYLSWCGQRGIEPLLIRNEWGDRIVSHIFWSNLHSNLRGLTDNGKRGVAKVYKGIALKNSAREARAEAQAESKGQAE